MKWEDMRELWVVEAAGTGIWFGIGREPHDCHRTRIIYKREEFGFIHVKEPECL